MDRIEVVTCGCYGRLIDREGGLGTFLDDYALRHGEAPPPNGCRRRERRAAIQFELIGSPYRRYEAVLVESLRGGVAEAGYG